MMNVFGRCRDCRSCQNKLPQSFAMIHFIPYSIPEFWSNLPFINQSWRDSLQRPPGINFRKRQILRFISRICHIQNTAGHLLSRCGFPHHLGPCIKTAPIPFSFLFNNSSAILGLYFFTFWIHLTLSICSQHIYTNIHRFGCFSITNSADFH